MSDIETLVRDSLQAVPGVEAAFIAPVTGETITVYAVAREHSSVDRGAILDAEAALAQQGLRVDVHVCAHQGNVRAAEMMPTKKLMFARVASESVWAKYSAEEREAIFASVGDTPEMAGGE